RGSLEDIVSRLVLAVAASDAPVPPLVISKVFCVPSALCSTARKSFKILPHVLSSPPTAASLDILVVFILYLLIMVTKAARHCQGGLVSRGPYHPKHP